jgi:hypothetical protein
MPDPHEIRDAIRAAQRSEARGEPVPPMSDEDGGG